MNFCVFLSAESSNASEFDSCMAAQKLTELFKRDSPSAGVVLHAPASLSSRDPYLEAEAPPICVVQFYFDSIESMESELTTAGKIQEYAYWLEKRSTGEVTCRHQAMAVRSYRAPACALNASALSPHTYLVQYDGSAEDNAVWLTRYVAQHPPIMVTLPGAYSVEVCSRIDYCSSLDMSRMHSLQRNKVVFIDADALEKSLNSTVRHELRRDFESLPAFDGRAPHFPMQSTYIR
jgi:hypothetical protein